MSSRENVLKFPELYAVELEAAEWIVRLDKGELSQEESARFQDWLARSPHHSELIMHAAGLWSELDGLKSFPSSHMNWPALELQHPSQSLRRAGFPGRLRSFAYVAASVVLVFMAGLVINALEGSSSKTDHSYETAIGGQRTVSLPDGSSILLNTNSRVDVHFSPMKREMRLLRGEAFFEVAHEKWRPFTVFAGHSEVRATGTAFAVHLFQKSVEVTVAKGAVALATFSEPFDQDTDHPRGTKKDLATVFAGQKALFGAKIEHLETNSDAELNRELAWRNGVLVFAGEPLAQVVANISRYTNITIEITDQTLNDLRVGGYLKIAEVDPIFDALRENYHIHVEWVNPSHVRLSR